MRHDDAVARMLEPVRQLERMLEPQRQLERMLEPQRQLERMLEPQRQLERMLEPQRQLERMLEPARRSARWAEMLEFEPWRRVDEALRVTDDSLSGLGRHLTSVAALTSDWRERVAGPVGVLSPFAGEPSSPSFCWMEQSGPEASPDLAFWSAGAPAEEPDQLGQLIEVNCEVLCAGCGASIDFKGSYFYQVGTNRVRAQVTVSPFCCMSCIERGLFSLEVDSRPPLLGLEGGRESTEPPRGRGILRLVALPAEHEDNSGPGEEH